MTDPDCTYYGVDGVVTGSIMVMTTQHGPTERERFSETLRAIHADETGPLGWGYGGGSPSRTAHALLADVLDIEKSAVDGDLIGAFLYDIVSNLTDEWRLRRSALLRWVRGYYSEQNKPCPYALPAL